MSHQQLWSENWRAALIAGCAEYGVPGAALALLHDGSQLVTSAGLADAATGRPVTPITIFRLGSVTKMFTAVMLLQSMAKRRALDQPVKSLMKDFSLADREAEARMTPRHLLSHTAGFEGDVLDPTTDEADALQLYAARAATFQQMTPPGVCFSYNNAALILAARLTEYLEGKSWSDLFSERICVPLGLGRTGVLWRDMPDGDVATSHVVDQDGRLRPHHGEPCIRALAPAGQTPWSTAGDCLAFGRMLLNEGCGEGGTSLLSSDLIREMRTAQVAGPTPTFASGWGLGVQLFNEEGTVFGHDGVVPGQNAFVRVVPKEALVFVLLSNGGDGRSLFHDLFGRVQRCLGSQLCAPPPIWPEKPPPLDPAPFIGRYASMRHAVEVSATEGELIARICRPADDGSGPVRLRRQGDDPSGELFLSRFPPNRLPTQQRFLGCPTDERSFLLFRGRLLAKWN